MTDEQKLEIRQQLLAQREEMLREVQEHRASDSSEALDADQDPGDRAERELERELDHRVRLDDQNLIAKIDNALLRLDAGAYQSCEACGAVIPLERLLAKPSVSLCVACQEAKELAWLKS